jgi:glucose-1-phosphate cytidylyltransferase
MKAVILAGGLGTRISEETNLKPKPMIEIGGKPIIWHIMKIYSAYGITEFIICCGYKGYIIKEYFEADLIMESEIVKGALVRFRNPDKRLEFLMCWSEYVVD